MIYHPPPWLDFYDFTCSQTPARDIFRGQAFDAHQVAPCGDLKARQLLFLSRMHDRNLLIALGSRHYLLPICIEVLRMFGEAALVIDMLK